MGPGSSHKWSLLLLTVLALENVLCEPIQVSRVERAIDRRVNDWPQPPPTPPTWSWEEPSQGESEPKPDTNQLTDIDTLLGSGSNLPVSTDALPPLSGDPGPSDPIRGGQGTSVLSDSSLGSRWFETHGFESLKKKGLTWPEISTFLRDKKKRGSRIGDEDEESMLESLMSTSPQKTNKIESVDRNKQKTRKMWCTTSQNMANIVPNPFNWEASLYWQDPSLVHFRVESYANFLELCAKKFVRDDLRPNVGCQCVRTEKTEETSILNLECPEPPPQTDSHKLWAKFQQKCRQFCGCDDERKNRLVQAFDNIAKKFQPTPTDKDREPTPPPTPIPGKATLTLANGIVVVYNGKPYRLDAFRKKYRDWRRGRTQYEQQMNAAQCATQTEKDPETCLADESSRSYGNLYSQEVPTAKCGVDCTTNQDCQTQSGERGCRCIASPTLDDKRAAGLDPIGWSNAVCLTMTAVLAATQFGSNIGSGSARLGGRGVAEEAELIPPPVCACNATYLSHACCESDSGFVWEPPHYKMGELDL